MHTVQIPIDGREYNSPAEVAVAYQGLARRIADRAARANRCAESWRDDLFSIAWQGVLIAARRWDGSRPFLPYATLVASRDTLQFIRTFVMRKAGITSIPGLCLSQGWQYKFVPEANGEFVLETVRSRGTPAMPEQVDEMIHRAKELFGNSKRFHVFRMRVSGMTLGAIAKELGYGTRQAVDLSYRTALTQLRESARRSGCDFPL